MKICLSSGHGKYIRGASSQYGDEVDLVRPQVEAIAEALRSLGVEVLTWHDDTSRDQSTNLSAICSWHNAQGTHDYDISCHMNCYDGHAHGCEILWKTQEELAAKVCAAICAVSGLSSRGAKYRSDLKFLNATHAKSILTETAFCDSQTDMQTYERYKTDIARAIAEAITGREVQPGPIPPQPPQPEPVPPTPSTPAGHPQLSEGSEGPAVVELQKTLGVQPADGDFGNITATQVEGFQAACGLTPDGVVGKNTWAAVDDLEARLEMGGPRLTPKLMDEIVELADGSDIAGYEWPDRGMSPPGYVPGMALCFAVALQDLDTDAAYATAMGKTLGSSSVDVLKWYEPEMKKLGLNLDTPEGRLRSLFVLMIGLGMRESSGRYCEGRDMSASNVASDTCEAGLFQSSANLLSADPSLPGLLSDFWQNPNGFLSDFNENVDPTAENLDCYGSGEGARFQWLAKFCPAFAVMTAGVGLRSRKDHWGPVVRKEITLRKDADDLLKQVQALIDTVA